MTIGALTTGAQTVSAAGAITPTAGLDISAISGDFTVKVRISALTAAKKARIQLEDSVTAFTASIPLAVINVKGEIAAPNELYFNFRKYQIPSTRATTSGVLRLNVTEIDSGGTITLQGWIEY